jgi:hypothetical protein
MFQRLIAIVKRLSPSAVAYLEGCSDDDVLELLLLAGEHGIDEAIDTIEQHQAGLML